ncbi:tRNA (adenosine(37)-N6)-threonylcarbamoyltransferase complex ATPase subunit type 1 TsaE [Lichenihabitans sp. Uapishka_5]|uniref:tRNA (adenosine(37)-N6)-threonylcarbamoyltransferase complex ATPase subunit type 1 TsaE n=1 Tax=Lichenihabitans sp. Uapishka_5 TaxID=3037302 RepID=UPI0029E7FA90|nr:tRNA (adenosine(37)-N6)-threonylcarbamoyltransferase complex ATPase subunit type 1 TsaE [Lichenihabitans sp. Uapishka_5]MDX7953566.1 tRNA (adenosine(37)-N6)-threonylcarbamoyltransferase complex ATPase subunit type 1 TsaE [Lichenihabitans sp. Uapishka_5]
MGDETAAQPARWSLEVSDEAELAGLVETMAATLRAGDFVCLAGGLGAGKTTFARALIRSLLGDPEAEVPSPTFTLLQSYEAPHLTLTHADFYRLQGEDDLNEIGWDEAAEGALVLVEWPERIADRLPADRYEITFGLVPALGPGARTIAVAAHGTAAPRLEQARRIETLLERAGFSGARRRFMTGDASTRAYERLTAADGSHAVLMISPPRTDAIVVRFGKPYHHVARLAGDIGPFLAIDGGLAARGISVPRILAAEPRRGLAVIEDLGDEPIVRHGAPIPERYEAAVGLLAWMHDQPLPETLAGPEGSQYSVPPYDLDALLIEAELVLDWYAPEVARITLPASARANFISICSRLFAEVLAGPKTWCLRDYHSPNLIWQPNREGLARVGVIDFQDTVLGHPAYDLASLLQDARVTVPDALELKLLGAYAQHRRSNQALFDMVSFAEAYAILGVQRNTKILGAFARLNKRDRKPQYLAHLPRIEGYLARGLAHPALHEMRFWYQTYLPRILGLRR